MKNAGIFCLPGFKDKVSFACAPLIVKSYVVTHSCGNIKKMEVSVAPFLLDIDAAAKELIKFQIFDSPHG